MKNWKRTLLIGFVWGYIFLWWFVRGFLFKNWQFDFFSLSKANGWLFLVDEFQQGWVINDTSTVIFFAVLFLSFPIYFFGWRYFLKIEWLKIVKRNWNRLVYFLKDDSSSSKKTNKFEIKKKSSKTIRPRALDSAIRPISKESEIKVPVDEPVLPTGQKPQQNTNPYGGGYSSYGENKTNAYEGSRPYSGGMGAGYTPPADSPFNKGFTLPSMDQGFSMASSPAQWEKQSSSADDMFENDMFEDVLLSDIKMPERKRVNEDIPALFENAGYTVLSDAVIGAQSVAYVAISEKRVIVAVEDTQSGDWLADEERFNGEDPLWFSESSHRVSPVFQLLETVKGFMERLAKNGYSGTVLPLFIEKSGIIINAEDMLTTWKDLSVVVCRTDMGGPDELKTVEQTLITGEKPTEEIIQKVKMSL